MLFDPLLTCESNEVSNSQLEESIQPDNIITEKCVVFFRTSDSYTGDYGFDWLREGDSGRKGDVPYDQIIGRYARFGFVKDIREYDRFADREFRSLIIASEKNEDEFIYSVPIMSLLKSKSATFNLIIEAEKKPKELRFVYNENYFKLSEEAIFLPMVGKYILEDALTIECIEEFNKDQKILVEAIYDNGEDYLAGGFVIKANDKNHRRKLNVVLIRVKANFGIENRMPTIEGKETLLRKYFAQFYINANFTTKILDLNESSFFDEEYYTPIGLNFPNRSMFTALNASFLNANPDISNTEFRNYYKVYFFDEICNSGDEEIFGISNGIPSKEIIVFRPGLQDATVAHELFHALGLLHSFDHENKYVFEENKTDNIMDYSDMEGIPVIASWKFQWRLVQKHLPKDD